MKKDKTPYKLTCILMTNPQMAYETTKKYYSCWFKCKILECEPLKEYSKLTIVCQIQNKEQAKIAKNYKKSQRITMFARLNKTIRITEDINNFIITEAKTLINP